MKEKMKGKSERKRKSTMEVGKYNGSGKVQWKWESTMEVGKYNESTVNP